MSPYDDTPYQTGIECPFCAVAADKRCVTKGGNNYTELCHAGRRKAADEAGIVLTTHAPERGPENVRPESVRRGGPPATNIQRLKLALWFIEAMGSVDDAKKYMALAVSALETCGEEKKA